MPDLLARGLFAQDAASLPADAVALPGAHVLVEFGADAPRNRLPSDLRAEMGSIGLPQAMRERHQIVVGRTGCGKTTRHILPTIIQHINRGQGLTVCLSAKGDLSPVVLEACRRKGARLYYVSPTEPARSLRWNPLAHLGCNGSSLALATTLADLVKTGTNDTGHFRGEAISRLAPTIEVCRQHGADGNLHAIADAFTTLAKLQAFARRNDIPGLEEFATMASDGHNARTTLSHIQGSLACFAADDVGACLSGDDLDLSALGDEPAVLLIHLPEQDSARLCPFTTLFVGSLIDALYRKAGASSSGRLTVECTLVLDEFASALGRLDIANKINTLRSRGIHLVAAVQTTAQIVQQYEADARGLLAGFGTTVLMPPVTLQDAEHMSLESGTMLAETATMVGGERVIRIEERRLLTPHEIGGPPADPKLGLPVTWFGPATPPFHAYLSPVYDWPEWRDFMARLREGAVRIADLLPPERVESPLPAQAKSDARRAEGAGRPACIWCRRTDERLTDTTHYTPSQFSRRINTLLARAGYQELAETDSARKWMDAFVRTNANRQGVCVRVLEELALQRISVRDFYLAYVYGNTEKVEAALLYAKYRNSAGKDKEKKR